LVIGTSTSDPDPDAVSLEALLILLESTDDPFESGCNVTEVGSACSESAGPEEVYIPRTTTDDQNFAARDRLSTGHEVHCVTSQRGNRRSLGVKLTDSLRIFIGLAFSWRTRILSVVCELMSVARSRNGVRVDNGSTA